MLNEGQVLWLKLRFNNRPGDISRTVHPYIIVDIDHELNYVELIQCDSYEEKEYKALMNQNVFLDATDETVFDKHGFAQLDNCFKVELDDCLKKYRRTKDCMIRERYTELKRKYILYKLQNSVSENKTVYITLKELKTIND